MSTERGENSRNISPNRVQGEMRMRNGGQRRLGSKRGIRGCAGRGDLIILQHVSIVGCRSGYAVDGEQRIMMEVGLCG